MNPPTTTKELLDKALEHVSFSRMELWKKSRADFIRKYIYGEEQPITPQMQYGKEIHEQFAVLANEEMGTSSVIWKESLGLSTPTEIVRHTYAVFKEKLYERVGIDRSVPMPLTPEYPIGGSYEHATGTYPFVGYVDLYNPTPEGSTWHPLFIEIKVSNDPHIIDRAARQLALYSYFFELACEQKNETYRSPVPMLVVLPKDSKGYITGEVAIHVVPTGFPKDAEERVTTFIDEVHAHMQAYHELDELLHTCVTCESQARIARERLHCLMEKVGAPSHLGENAGVYLVSKPCTYTYSTAVKTMEKSLTALKNEERKSGTAKKHVATEKTLRIQRYD